MPKEVVSKDKRLLLKQLNDAINETQNHMIRLALIKSKLESLNLCD